MAEHIIKAKLDIENIDEVQEKVEKLVETLEKANSLLKELALYNLESDLNVQVNS